jgi:hypothetical protein
MNNKKIKEATGWTVEEEKKNRDHGSKEVKERRKVNQVARAWATKRREKKE